MAEKIVDKKGLNGFFKKVITGATGFFHDILDSLYSILSGEKRLLIFLGVLSVILNWFLEASLNKNLLTGLASIFTGPIAFIYNALIIFCVFSIMLLLKRRFFYLIVGCVFWLTLAITNFVVLQSRNTPLNASDFRIIKSAFGIIKIYLNLLEQILVALLIIFAITLLILALVKGKKSERNMRFSVPTFAVILSVTTITTLLYCVSVIGSHFSDLPSAYKEYGFAFSFICSVVDRGIDEPENYTDESVHTLKVQLEEGQDNPDDSNAQENSETVPATKEKPNIIFLQLESFYDPMNIEDLEFSSDPVPVFRSLVENYSSGKLTVPSIGAGTANTEFEVLTGMDIDFFGIAEYPYLSILQNNTCESIAYDVAEYGYTTNAMHNHTGSFYDRHIVFPNLGFDTYTPLEHMKNIRINKLGWARDAMLVDEITGVMASTPDQVDFVYAISVQAHGKYPTTMEEYELLYGTNNPPLITVTGNEDDPEKPGVDYWINQVHEVDTFIGSLISTISNSEEPTVLVMFGDHLPSFTLENWNITDGTLYQTQYVIWSNFYMGEKKTKDLNSFELSSYVMDMFDIESGYVNKLHQRYSDNNVDYSTELHLLQYDLLYGEKKISEGQALYETKNMKFGYSDIIIDNVEIVGNSLFVYGSNFNEYSRVYINGNKKDTDYINDSCVSVGNVDLDKGDTVVVTQVTTDFVELGSGNTYEITEDQATQERSFFDMFREQFSLK